MPLGADATLTLMLPLLIDAASLRHADADYASYAATTLLLANMALLLMPGCCCYATAHYATRA